MFLVSYRLLHIICFHCFLILTLGINPSFSFVQLIHRVEVREIGDKKVTVLEQKLDEDTSVATILVRASTENVLNDIERALDDGIHAVKTLLSDPRLLPGAGAVELELSRQLKLFADTETGLDQYAIRKFADALDVVPRTLAENSGCDPTVTMHKLHETHIVAAATTIGSGKVNSIGFDIEEMVPRDSTEAQIYDLYATKLNALRLAVDAAITILKVDQIVMSKPAGGPKPRNPQNDIDD
jgi:T-complex protein 1 subunit theta